METHLPSVMILLLTSLMVEVLDFEHRLNGQLA
jgi:hypothetical protein